MNIYPNPSHGMINIAFKAEVRANITVYSAIGEKLVETSSIGDKILTIDLNKFSSGVYVLHIESDNGEQRIERITIKK